ncbi:hypothetical protein [Luteimonas panaciterrae]|uniref:hypothetical protein n=1 Tax=Luteimonas panaciterrae TaxID=363885 RepID=UPI001CF9F7AA|nr:hypothetical protein [Luteimonas panaciterrae]
MFNLFAYDDVSLGRAGWCLLIGVFGGTALGVVLEQLGISNGPVLLVVLISNLFAAWFIAKAAGALGKNPWLYGLLSAFAPPIALILFLSLRNPGAAPSLIRGGESEAERLASIMQDHGVGESASGMAAWSAFKAYGHEVFGSRGVGLLFQAGTYEFSGSPRFYFNPVCQFEMPAADGGYDHFEQLLCELTCPPSEELKGIDITLWSFDYPSADAFFAAVEAMPGFRIAASQPDYRVSIRYEAV